MKNLKTKEKSKNLDYVNIELSFIKAKKRTISYKFKIPKYGKVYLIFHILLLKLADPKRLI